MTGLHHSAVSPLPEIGVGVMMTLTTIIPLTIRTPM